MAIQPYEFSYRDDPTRMRWGFIAEDMAAVNRRLGDDRKCLVLADCVGSYFPEFQRVGLQMVSAQGGIFGWVADSADLLAALAPAPSTV